MPTPTAFSSVDGTKVNGTGPLMENGNGVVQVDADVEPLHLNRPTELRRTESEREKEEQAGEIVQARNDCRVGSSVLKNDSIVSIIVAPCED